MKISSCSLIYKLVFRLFSPLLILLPIQSIAQCTGISLQTNSTESRCEASGSLSINITGTTAGSNLSYAIVSAPPLFPPSQLNNYQSSSLFGSLPAGNYIVVVQITNGAGTCTDTVHSVVSGNYQQLSANISTVNNTSCVGQSANGSISIMGINGRVFTGGNYQYQLLSPAAFANSNTTGNFTNLPGGTYSVRVYDSCDNFQTREVTLANTVVKYSYAISYFGHLGCDSIQVNMFIHDSLNNNINNYSGFSYGYYDDNGNFTGFNPLSLDLIIAPIKKDSLTLFIKDPCGNIQTLFDSTGGIRYWFATVANSVTGYNCNSFNANFSLNLINLGIDPVFTITCAPDSSLIGNQSNTGIFNGLPYGSYCLNIRDSCGHSSNFQFAISGGFQISNSDLDSYSCSSNYGSLKLLAGYQLIAPLKFEVIDSSFAGTNKVIQTIIYDSLYTNMNLSDSLPINNKLYFRFTDPCGNSNTIGPYSLNPLVINYGHEVQPLCINTANLTYHVSASAYTAQAITVTGPNGYLTPFTFYTNDDTITTYTNIPYGTYYIQTYLYGCAQYHNDTIYISPYIEPVLFDATSYTCDSTVANNYSIDLDVRGGLSPYYYEIVGSTPDNIVRPPQSGSTFSGLAKNEIVQLRASDACGNSTSNSVIIKGLQPRPITLDGIPCSGNSLLLHIEPYPNAIYSWTLNGIPLSSGPTDTSITIQPFSSANAGNYTCNAIVGLAGCDSVQSTLSVANICELLSLDPIDLKGTENNNLVLLNWATMNQSDVNYFEVLRNTNSQDFIDIGTIKSSMSNAAMSNYTFKDIQPISQTTFYKLKITLNNGSIEYSNTISIEPDLLNLNTIQLFPNPFSNQLSLTLNAKSSSNASIIIYDVLGKLTIKENWTILPGLNEKAITCDPGMPYGTYILEINSGNNSEFRAKIVKVR